MSSTTPKNSRAHGPPHSESWTTRTLVPNGNDPAGQGPPVGPRPRICSSAAQSDNASLRALSGSRSPTGSSCPAMWQIEPPRTASAAAQSGQVRDPHTAGLAGRV